MLALAWFPRPPFHHPTRAACSSACRCSPACRRRRARASPRPRGRRATPRASPSSADATALTPVSGLLVRRADARALIASDAAVAAALLRALAAKLRRTTEQVEAVGLRPLPRRLAGVLLKLAAADPAGLVRLPQGQIASLVAASRPKVNAALAEFRARRLVAPRRAGFKLVDPAGLRALAEQE